MNKNLTRRRLLKEAMGTAIGAVTFPYIVSPSALGKDGQVAASERIAVGAIGVGGQGTNDMKSLMADARTQVVAVCDPQAANRRRAGKMVEDYYGKDKEWRGCRDYVDFREMLAREDIDAVTIGTPDHWHAIIAVQAAVAGKDIYCQKPLALTINQGRKMVEAVHRYGVVFQTGTQQRSEERFRRACELVRNGRVGKLRTIEVEVPGSMSLDGFYFAPAPEDLDYDLWLGPAPMAPYSPKRVDAFGWRWISDYAGGCVTDWGAHHIDIAQWAMGTTHTGPIEVQGEAVFPKDGLFDTAVHWRFECAYASGVRVICFARNEFVPGQYPNGIKFTGDRGWLYVDRGRIDAEPKSILQEEIANNEVRLYKSDNHYANFLDCIKTRQPTAAPVEEAHRSVAVCHLANIAMRLGRRIKWDPDNQVILDDEQAARMLSRPMRSPWGL
jgi:predicted dehydrogenase